MSDAKQLYSEYEQVPFYRKQLFFWITYLIMPPIAIGLLILGDVYYQDKGQVKAFGLANRIAAGLLAIAILYGLLHK